jgi:hypothetical protein
MFRCLLVGFEIYIFCDDVLNAFDSFTDNNLGHMYQLPNIATASDCARIKYNQSVYSAFSSYHVHRFSVEYVLDCDQTSISGNMKCYTASL